MLHQSHARLLVNDSDVGVLSQRFAKLRAAVVCYGLPQLLDTGEVALGLECDGVPLRRARSPLGRSCASFSYTLPAWRLLDLGGVRNRDHRVQCSIGRVHAHFVVRSCCGPPRSSGTRRWCCGQNGLNRKRPRAVGVCQCSLNRAHNSNDNLILVQKVDLRFGRVDVDVDLRRVNLQTGVSGRDCPLNAPEVDERRSSLC